MSSNIVSSLIKKYKLNDLQTTKNLKLWQEEHLFIW
jgi:hypothetical protein